MSGANVAEDLRCVGCGYDLRGLSIDDRCPECGTSIARSHLCMVCGDKLSAADPTWLRRVHHGQLLLVAGCVVYWLGVTGVVVLSSMLANRSGLTLAGPAWLGLNFIALSLMFAGSLGVTTIDPRISMTEQALGLRRLTRVLTLIALVLWAISLVDEIAGLVMPFASRMLDWGFGIVLSLLVIAVTLFIAKLADRIPDPKLARQTRGAAILFGISLFVAAAAAFAMFSIRTRSSVSLDTVLILAIIISILLAFYGAITVMNLWWTFRIALSSQLKKCRAGESGSQMRQIKEPDRWHIP